METEAKYVVDIMTPNPVIVGPATTSWNAERVAQKRSVHDLLVVDRYRLTGVVCRCDLRYTGAETRVRDCMRRDVVTIDDQQTANAAREILEGRPIGCLPVLDWTGCLRGVITRRDLLKAGVLRRADLPTCSACGSTHALPRERPADSVLFCSWCMDAGRPPMTSSEDAYFETGGGD